MLCHFCEQEKEGLPFKCNYCGNFFCSEHRLPENHACPRVGGPIQPGYAKIPNTFRDTVRPRERANLPAISSGRSRFRLRYPSLFSQVERKHIAMATGLMALVGLSMVAPSLLLNPDVLLVLVPGFVISFLGHELAHKFLAQRNGLWAEFRTNMYGLMLTAVSIVFPFKFLAPGQTNIVGNANKEIIGSVGLVGPGFNILVSIALFGLSRVTSFPVSYSLAILSGFNAWLALINLIPYGSLDGTRIFEWDRTRWAISLITAIALVILAYYF